VFQISFSEDIARTSSPNSYYFCLYTGSDLRAYETWLKLFLLQRLVTDTPQTYKEGRVPQARVCRGFTVSSASQVVPISPCTLYRNILQTQLMTEECLTTSRMDTLVRSWFLTMPNEKRGVGTSCFTCFGNYQEKPQRCLELSICSSETLCVLAYSSFHCDFQEHRLLGSLLPSEQQQLAATGRWSPESFQAGGHKMEPPGCGPGWCRLWFWEEWRWGVIGTARGSRKGTRKMRGAQWSRTVDTQSEYCHHITSFWPLLIRCHLARQTGPQTKEGAGASCSLLRAGLNTLTSIDHRSNTASPDRASK
jgi:hypothetical protein